MTDDARSRIGAVMWNPERFSESEVTSLDDLVLMLSRPHLAGQFFRGQSNESWQLLPSLDRLLLKAIGPDATYEAFESSTIGLFKRHASTVLSSLPDDDDFLSWLTLMQHFGAPTRLLDWTESPFVALYFAVVDLDPEVSAALWVLNPKSCAWIASGSKSFSVWNHAGFNPISKSTEGSRQLLLPPSKVSFSRAQSHQIRRMIEIGNRWPLPVIPEFRFDRMAAQQSVFTVSGSFNFPLESLCDKTNWGPEVDFINEQPTAMPGEEDQIIDSRQVLQKISIRGDWKRDLLQLLHTMGITSASLFPGIDGLGAMISNSIYQTVKPADQISGAYWSPSHQA